MANPTSTPTNSVTRSTAANRLAIVLNTGNAYTKIAYRTDDAIVVRKLRSGIMQATDLDTNAFTFNRLNDAGRSRTGYDYNPWVMFHGGDRPSQIEQGKAVYALQLFIGLTWDLIEDGMTIDLHLLVHNPAELKDLLIKSLNRAHDCTHNRVRKTFTIAVGKVAKEGLGLARTAPQRDVLILDFGGDTLIPTRFRHGKTSKEMLGGAITQFGTSGLIRRLCEFAPSAIGSNPSEANCIKAIESNRLGDAADEVIREFWHDAIGQVKRRNLELFSGVDGVYLAGGLTKLKRFAAIAKTDTAINPRIVADAQTADIQGFYAMLDSAGLLYKMEDK
jgi:hypothetical protein